MVLVGLSDPIYAEETQSSAEEGQTEWSSIDGETNQTSQGHTGQVATVSTQVLSSNEFMGSAGYEIQLPLPASRGAVKPNLSFNYSSDYSNPNDWLGYGWQASLPTVRQQKKLDGSIEWYVSLGGGSKKIIQIDSQAALNAQYGVKLYFSSETYGDVYEEELSDSKNIYLHVQGRIDKCHNVSEYDHQWVVIDKMGTYFCFGAADFYDNIYYLTQVVDANGNELVIDYDETLKPLQMEYQDILIEFVYDENRRSYAISHDQNFYHDNQIRVYNTFHDTLLSDVIVKSGSQRLQRYNFHYVTLQNGHKRLASFQRFGKTDSEYLPKVSFRHYNSYKYELDSSPVYYDAHVSRTLSTGGAVEHDGFVDYFLQFIDMNADGLKDKVVAYDGKEEVHVFFNTGSNFEFVRGRSVFKDPFYDSECEWVIHCARVIERGEKSGYGQLIKSTNFTGGLSRHQYQYVFLMDMNGDALPDRVRGIRSPSDPQKASFEISFHTGTDWDVNTVIWDDPYEADTFGYIGSTSTSLPYQMARLSGVSDNEKWFMDMNADGLVDRVVRYKDDYKSGFNVYYNNGTSFDSLPTYFSDPTNDDLCLHDGDGYLAYGGHQGTTVFTKDFNGDGLPDRICATGEGVRVWLLHPKLGYSYKYQNLSKFYSAVYSDNYWTVNSFAQEDQGAITENANWIDLNGDGYLDRIVFDENQDYFKIRYYDGGSLSGETYWRNINQLNDPVSDVGVDSDYRGHGKVIAKHLNGNPDQMQWGYRFHTLFLDISGDGIPDRMTLTPRKSPYTGSQYEVYIGKNNNVEVSDLPRHYKYSFINQPFGKLKEVINEYNVSSIVEYSDSVIPLQYDATYGIIPMTHRHMPFNKKVVRRIYNFDLDYSCDSAEPECQRYEKYRPTIYSYLGGHYYVRRPSTTQSYFSQFLGFQKVVRTIQKGLGESWKSFFTENTYHQSLGVDALLPADYALFDSTAYQHYVLAGKLYQKRVVENSVVRESLKYNYSVNNAVGLFECSPFCEVQLDSQAKTFRESQTGYSAKTSIQFEYDTNLNLVKEVYLDKNDQPLLVKETEYFDKSLFDADLHIRSLPKWQKKSLGSKIYRSKFFQYDNKGNPEQESWQTDSTQIVTVNRRYNTNGTLSQMTDVNGLTKKFIYDSYSIYPVEIRVANPSGGSDLILRTSFDRLTGNENYLQSINGVAQRKVYDDFGRVIAEYVVDRSGVEHQKKRFKYEYFDHINSSLSSYTIYKTSEWNYVEGQLQSEVLAATIKYSNAIGLPNQSCILTENETYRLLQEDYENAGRIKKVTTPVASSQCDYLDTLNTSSNIHVSYYDFQDRYITQDQPPQDTNSPIGILTQKYSISANGLNVVRKEYKGRWKQMRYDEFGNMVESKDSNGQILEYTYNPVGDLEMIQSQGVILKRMEYDESGRKIRMQDANLGEWSYHYNQYGLMDYQIDAKGQKVEVVYDSFRRKQRKNYYDSSGALEKYELYIYDSGDAVHNVQAYELYAIREYDSSDQLQIETKFGYDQLFRAQSHLTRYIPELGEFTQVLNYNPGGTIKSMELPGGESVYYQYFITGAIQKVCSTLTCDESNGELYYKLDAHLSKDLYGAVIQEFYGNNVVESKEYYPNSRRLKKSVVQNGSNIYSTNVYHYDAYSNLILKEDQQHAHTPGGYSSLQYDDSNRLISYTPQNHTFSKNLSYSQNGNIKTNSYSFGSQVYEYNGNQPNAVTDIGSDHYEYDLNGNMTTSPQRIMAYNAANQMSSVEMKNGSIVEYSYDYSGVRYKKEIKRNDAYNHIINSKTYYISNRVEVRNDSLFVTIHVGKKKLVTKNLGKLSVLLGTSGDSARLLNINKPVTVAKAAPFSVMGFGLFLMLCFRPVEKPAMNRKSHWVRHIYYNSLVLIRSVQAAVIESVHSFHQGRMFYKVASLAFVFYFILYIPLIKCAHAADQLSLNLPGQAPHEPTFMYHHNDYLGSSYLMTEGNKDGAVYAGIKYKLGDLLQRIEYHPYGQEKFILNPNLMTHPSFTGQKYDVSTGLYYYQARYYDPKLARFTQADTFIPNIADDQSYNAYSYVRNNPIKYTDPSGHSFMSALGSFLGGLVTALVFFGMVYLSGGAAAPSLLAAVKAMSFAQVVGTSVFAGMIGGLVGGMVSGGMRGAIIGFVFGGLTSGVTSAVSFGLDKAFNASFITKIAGISYQLINNKDGWEGFADLGAGLLGAYVGQKIAQSWFNPIEIESTQDSVVETSNEAAQSSGSDSQSQTESNQTVTSQSSSQSTTSQQPSFEDMQSRAESIMQDKLKRGVNETLKKLPGYKQGKKLTKYANKIVGLKNVIDAYNSEGKFGIKTARAVTREALKLMFGSFIGNILADINIPILFPEPGYYDSFGQFHPVPDMI